MKKNIIIIILSIAVVILCISFVLYLLLDNIKGDVNKHMEIEKKYLIDVNKIPYDLSTKVKIEIEQTYINYAPEIRVRKITFCDTNEAKYVMTIKRYINDGALEREETEFDITKEEYIETLKSKKDNTVYKDRYEFYNEEGTYIAIDIFKEQLQGLGYMEIEFEDANVANEYNTPDWVIKDVTEDKNYKNGYLARFGIPKN